MKTDQLLQNVEKFTVCSIIPDTHTASADCNFLIIGLVVYKPLGCNFNEAGSVTLQLKRVNFILNGRN
jgi:hypothetical protein